MLSIRMGGAARNESAQADLQITAGEVQNRMPVKWEDDLSLTAGPWDGIGCIYNWSGHMIDSANELALIVGNECLAGRVRRLSRVITNIYDHALKPFGVKINQASILVFLAAKGDSSPGDLGKRLQMEKSTVSRNIDRMRKNGWVENVVKNTGPEQLLRITPSGQLLLIESHSQWKDAQAKALALLGEEGAQALQMLTERIRTSP
jgi:DNA-binding MarR family transcriptional regulator